MGFYIQGPTIGKAAYLVREHNAVPVIRPDAFKDIPEDKALICVVSNGGVFDAAGLIYSAAEFGACCYPRDTRQKHWLLMDKKKAHELAGYNGG